MCQFDIHPGLLHSLDKGILNNYRPVSNLPYLFKAIERVVAARLSAHMSEYNL